MCAVVEIGGNPIERADCSNADRRNARVGAGMCIGKESDVPPQLPLAIESGRSDPIQSGSVKEEDPRKGDRPSLTRPGGEQQ